MPVSRNLSLPASIQGRKYKKRPEGRTELQKDITTTKSRDLITAMHTDEKSPSLSTSTYLVKKLFTLPTSPTDLDSPTPSAERTSSSRTTLSQPCIGSASVRATSIFPHLFLGSESDVADEQLMAEQKITRVLNVSITCKRPSHLDDSHFRRIAVHDNYTERIEPHLDGAVEFLEEARLQSERVLIHCVAGVSRSATVAIAYVMYYLKLSLNEAYRFVKEKRPTISPNFNFLGQLIEFERRLRDNGHLPNNEDEKIQQQPATVTNDEETKIKENNLALNQSCSKSAKTDFTLKPFFNNPTVTSSFCRRRQAPKLDLSRNGTDYKKSADLKQHLPTRGAGVLLDLHVQAPVEENSRRLGSDGVEDESNEPFHSINDQWSLEGGLDKQKSSSLPRRLPSKVCSIPLNYHHQIESELKPATAPTTPAASKILFVQNPDDEDFPVDVEMSEQEDDQPQLDPPSPVTSLKKNVPDTNVLFVTSYSSVADSNRFISRKSRSPKIMKKSFTPSLRQSFGYQAFLSSKANSSLQMPSSATLKHDQKVHPRSCISPGASNRLSSLTLSSPNASKDAKNLFVVGTSCLHRPPTYDAKSTSSFKLVPSNELRIRWRGNKSNHVTNAPRNTKKVIQSSGSNSETSSSSQVINCCNMEMVSCS